MDNKHEMMWCVCSLCCQMVTTTYDLEWHLKVISTTLDQSIAKIWKYATYISYVTSHVCPIPSHVSLHSNYFKVVQGYMHLEHKLMRGLLAIASFLVHNPNYWWLAAVHRNIIGVCNSHVHSVNKIITLYNLHTNLSYCTVFSKYVIHIFCCNLVW